MNAHVDYLNFCEHVRRQASRIASTVLAGNPQKAAEMALALCNDAALRKAQALQAAGQAQTDALELDTSEEMPVGWAPE